MKPKPKRMTKKLAKQIGDAYYRVHHDNEITITVTQSELKKAFSSYENFKQFFLDKFGIDVDYIDYLERISDQ